VLIYANAHNILVEEAQYLLDVFVEGGYAESKDLPHLDRLQEVLRFYQRKGVA
jgi:hypothetical protein